MSRKALGRGLGALIPGAEDSRETAKETPPDAPSPSEPVSPQLVSLDEIEPNPYQPRTVFDEEALDELANSIRTNGLIQPLVVRARNGGGFELIAGERRFLASRRAGLERVPVVVREATRREMLEVAVVENLQREDLNPLEEAEAYQRLAAEFGLTQEQIADRVGKNRSTVTNALRLLSLPEEIRALVSRGILSGGHARALLSLPDDGRRLRLAREIERKGLSVRQTEQLVHQGKKTKPTARKRTHPALDAWEDRLRTRFATQVRIVGGVAKGRVELHYFSEEDLERILELTGTGSQL